MGERIDKKISRRLCGETFFVTKISHHEPKSMEIFVIVCFYFTLQVNLFVEDYDVGSFIGSIFRTTWWVKESIKMRKNSRLLCGGMFS